LGSWQASSQDASGEKWFITEKLRYDLRKATQRWSRPVFAIKEKVTRFEALALTLDCHQTDSGFSENSTKFSIYHLVSLPLQVENFHHTSLLMLVHFDWVNAVCDLLIKQWIRD
jgi:hypothetical protein